MSKRLNNTANCGAPLWGHGNRSFSEYRPQQDYNSYAKYNVSNNNEYRMMLQRNGQSIIDQQRNRTYANHACNTCDTCGRCTTKSKEEEE